MIKNFFKLLGAQAACSLGCFLFVMMFPGIIDFRLGEVLYSLLAIVVLFDVLFTCTWNIANHKRKMIKIHNNHLSEDEAEQKMTYKDGYVLAGAYTVFNVIILALSIIFADISSGLSTMAFRIWFCEFVVGFTYSVRHVNYLSTAIAVFPLIPIIAGYIGGAKNVNAIENFMTRLVYKKKKTK
mgnify:CR=1 FL=1